MLKFFGLSSKEKLAPKEMAAIYVAALNDVIDQGYVEIMDFINHNNNLESNPKLGINDIKWFRFVIFLGNINLLNLNFEEEEIVVLRAKTLDAMFAQQNDEQRILSMEKFLDYEQYFSDLINEYKSVKDSMAYAIFEKYNINDYQGDLFKRKNEPNPIFFNELKNLISHFIWNWDEYLKKYRIKF